MQIDSHQHFWRYDAVRDAWITDRMRVLQRDFLPEHLAPELVTNGIDATVAVQADQSEDETNFLLGLCDENRAERDARIAGVVGWVDLRAPNLPERLEYFSQFEKLRGFRHIVQDEADDRFLLRDDFCRGISRLREFGFTYDILIYARQLPAAVKFVERFPDQPFVVDHIAKPAIDTGEIATSAIESWERNLRAVAANPNVFCKLSGLITEADWDNWNAELLEPYLGIAFDAFGADRLMFGSDWPVCLLAGSYDRVKGLVEDFVRGRPVLEQAKIFGETAARFYGLKVRHGLTTQR
jgi:L-fuconolactonase